MSASETLKTPDAAPGRKQAASGKGRVGEVISVTGSHALVMIEPQADLDRIHRPQIGAIMSIDSGASVVLGLVSAMSVPAPSLDTAGGDIRIVEVELIGEFSKPTQKTPARFRRGVSTFPTLGDDVHVATRDELSALFAVNGAASVKIGVVKQDVAIPATVAVNDLFSRHCAVLGTTGAGKSCAVTLMLLSVLERYSQAHIVLLDPHNEYAQSFGDLAVVFDTANLTLPYWMLTFDELIEVLYPSRAGYDEEIDILADLVPAAKKMNLSTTAGGMKFLADRRSGDAGAITVDTPVPYRISELMGLIDKALGGLDSTRSIAPYKRLRNRLYAISQDARYSFMFGGLTVQDTMASFLGQLFRIPVGGHPVSIIELGGLPTEVAQVVVSVIARLAYDFGMWSHGAAPIALIIEDAHRYAPADPSEGFAPTRRALIRIAKEGRKTGVSLWVASQRPTELDPTVLSQCNTIFAMRLANQADQEALRAAIPDASTSLLNCLPSLGLGEAIAVGEGVPLPTRIRFNSLPRELIPRSLTASFTDGWSVEADDEGFIERIVEQWRAQRMILPEV
ncbi:MAG TPA: ATP-binding protein [Parvularculaceae bacterium]|nr:ATP-binding protein [Parvularculaceae bacterium]